ncbi:hypothetical protein TrRE_jg12069 [Triparma retinervis]|uniref:Uncharacterized protein n=1 Tax=Triparma retinervis TaxID=2557542 RepID=A0A9W7DPR9_9STRA|nr:hypothetical protein TrRE_jg12069 [Triparma retinervis]
MVCRDRCVQLFGTACAAALAAMSQTDPCSSFLLATQGQGLDLFAIPGTVFALSQSLYNMILEQLATLGDGGGRVSRRSEALQSLLSKLKGLAGAEEEGNVLYLPRTPKYDDDKMPAGYDTGGKVSHSIGFIAEVAPAGNLLAVIFLQDLDLIVVMTLSRKDVLPLYRAADKDVLDYITFITSIYYATQHADETSQYVLQILHGCRSDMKATTLFGNYMSYVAPDLVAFLLLFISKGTLRLGGGAGLPWWWCDWWWFWLHEGNIYSLGPAFSQFEVKLPQLRLQEGGNGLDAWDWMGKVQCSGREVTKDMLEGAQRFHGKGEMTWKEWGRRLGCAKNARDVKVRVRVILDMWARAELLSNLLSSVAPK